MANNNNNKKKTTKKKKKTLPANAGDAEDAGSISGSGRSPDVADGNPLQHSCLENFLDRGAWWAAAHQSQGVGHDWACMRKRTRSPHSTAKPHPVSEPLPTLDPHPGMAVGKQWGPGGGKTQAGMESQVATHIQTSWALSRLYHTSSSQKGPSVIPHKMPAHPLIIHLCLKWSNFQSLCFLSFKLQLSHLLSFNQ